MIDKFISKLEFQLRTLKSKERKKYLNNYEESIQEKIDSGISEKQAIYEIGKTKKIAEEILSSYNKEKLNMQPIYIFKRYFNKVYIYVDIAILIFSMVLSNIIFYCVLLSGLNNGLTVNKMTTHSLWLLFLIPMHIIMSYVFGLYKIENISNLGVQILRTIGVNAVVFVSLRLVFIFTNAFCSTGWFSIYIIFSCMLEIIIRMILFFVSCMKGEN